MLSDVISQKKVLPREMLLELLELSQSQSESQ